MRRLIVLAALLLVLVSPVKTDTAQVKLVGAQSRIENMARINKLTEEFNGHVKKYRAMVEKVPLGEIKNIEASDELAEMALTINQMIQIYNAFDEVSP